MLLRPLGPCVLSTLFSSFFSLFVEIFPFLLNACAPACFLLLLQFQTEMCPNMRCQPLIGPWAPNPRSLWGARQKWGSWVLCCCCLWLSFPAPYAFFKNIPIILIVIRDEIYGFEVIATNLIKWTSISPQTFSQLTKSPGPCEKWSALGRKGLWFWTS